MITKKNSKLMVFLVLLSGIASYGNDLRLGAEKFEEYSHLIINKKVGVVINHTSIVQDEHLIDFLLHRDIKVNKIFTPEHGFTGTADAGEEVKHSQYRETGIPVISLYGKNNKPLPTDLLELEVMMYDIQDVGVRFFTYISTLHLCMEACAEKGIKMIILDRPNPNGFYVDGPVLHDSLRSFVGMHTIPVVYGMTAGELALMINENGWLKSGLRCDLTIIPLSGYDHNYRYSLPVKPSPNLPNDQAVLLYPSLCLFEGTMMSVGRGTDLPFQIVGFPDSLAGNYVFIPESTEGAKNPVYSGKKCFGENFCELKPVPGFTLKFLMQFYYKLGSKYEFFNEYFEKLAGNKELRQQIISGFSEEDIRITWHAELEEFKKLRKKYLLYPDFD